MTQKEIKELFMYTLAIIIIVGVFILVGILITHEIPKENKDLLNIVVGGYVTLTTMVVSYFFGSSKGSADKNDLLKGN